MCVAPERKAGKAEASFFLWPFEVGVTYPGNRYVSAVCRGDGPTEGGGFVPSVLVTVGANASWDEEGKLQHPERWRREPHRRARSRLGVKAQGVRSEIGQHAGRRALQPEAGPGRGRSLHRAPECRGISACPSHSTEERARVAMCGGGLLRRR